MDKDYYFDVKDRAVPAINSRPDRLDKVLEWQQRIRQAVDEQLRIRRFGAVAAARVKYAAPFEIPPGGSARMEAWFLFVGNRSGDTTGLAKALEDALFAEDREVLDTAYHVRRGADVDGVMVRLVISTAKPASVADPINRRWALFDRGWLP